MRQALERMEYHRYSAVPIIDKKENILAPLQRGFTLAIKKFFKRQIGEYGKVLLKDVHSENKKQAGTN